MARGQNYPEDAADIFARSRLRFLSPRVCKSAAHLSGYAILLLSYCIISDIDLSSARLSLPGADVIPSQSRGSYWALIDCPFIPCLPVGSFCKLSCLTLDAAHASGHELKFRRMRGDYFGRVQN